MTAVQTFIGIDVGTSGIRVIALDTEGSILAQAESPLERERAQGAIHEQDTEHWWTLTCLLIQKVCSQVHTTTDKCSIRAISVASTSGTLVLTDRDGTAVRPAIMYDDLRAAEQADLLNSRFENGSARWNGASSVCKVLWVRDHEYSVWQTVHRILSPADWLMGRLSGFYNFSDYSNSLKLGYDFESAAWNPVIDSAGIRETMLPMIVAPGTSIATVSPQAASATGLPETCSVVAGATDGMTSLIASGAKSPGDSNTTLGTTLVWKTLSLEKPLLSNGIYAHRHPLGLWAPGAASNTGPGAITGAAAEDCEASDIQAAKHLPIAISCYPVARRSERFPFVSSYASTFFNPEPQDTSEAHAAQLQGLAFAEKWGYELISANGIDLSGPVYSTGSASRSRVFSELRANVLNKPVIRCQSASAALGAAILAASSTFFGGNLSDAITCAITIESVTTPNTDLTARYEDLYCRFREDCRSKGYDS